MAEYPLTDVEAELAFVAATLAQDGFLTSLVDLANAGLGLAIGMLVNGMIVTGQLGQSADLASDIDAEMKRAVERTPVDDSETWAETAAKAATMQTDALQSSLEERRKVEDEIETFSEENGLDARLPGSLHRAAIQLPVRTALTVKNAHISAAGQGAPTYVPVLRVNLSSVAAWWILPTDETGMSSVGLWNGGPESGDERPE